MTEEQNKQGPRQAPRLPEKRAFAVTTFNDEGTRTIETVIAHDVNVAGNCAEVAVFSDYVNDPAVGLVQRAHRFITGYVDIKEVPTPVFNEFGIARS